MGLLAERPGAMIFKVVGADTAVRYQGELKGPLVVVGREGSTDEVQKALQKAGRRPNHKDLFVVGELPGEECSSTKLRDAFGKETVPWSSRCVRNLWQSTCWLIAIRSMATPHHLLLTCLRQLLQHLPPVSL